MSRSQQVVRAVLALASLALVLLTVVASPAPVLVLVVLVVALTAYAVVRPQSWVVTVLVAGLVLHWLASVRVPESLGQWVQLLVAGWLVLIVHLAASLAASLPAAAPIPAASLRTWGRRAATVAVVLVPVWGLAAVSGLQGVAGEVGLTYAAIAGVALLALGAWVAMRRSSD